jgi:hypothetical protein
VHTRTHQIVDRLQTVSWWHFIWVTLLFAEVFTAGMNTLMGWLVWGDVSGELILIGVADALVVSLLVGTGLIALLRFIRDRDRRAKEENAKLVAELQVALAKIKTLHGIIPICAGCKKVREDSGYWKQVELYVSEHSDAEFSHGFCPECVERLYPEVSGD